MAVPKVPQRLLSYNPLVLIHLAFAMVVLQAHAWWIVPSPPRPTSMVSHTRRISPYGRPVAPFWLNPARTVARATAGTDSSNKKDQAQQWLDQARRMREEIAALEGRTVEQVEQEAQERRQEELARQREQSERRLTHNDDQASATSSTTWQGRAILPVPETAQDQVQQAKQAIERAFRDGLTRQIVRFTLLSEAETLQTADQSWPGGARQMYREAAGPMTRDLLQQIRAQTSMRATRGEGSSHDKHSQAPVEWVKSPTVVAQDILDFDGSALMTAHASTGVDDDVQAMVLPNTDEKYTADIESLDQAIGPNRLFLLVNPFWRNLDSWGFNFLAPRAKGNAQRVIFERGFQETYVVLQKSVTGEACLALKVYPYDWQLYAYYEHGVALRYTADEWIHLGWTAKEPMASDFAALLADRKEFRFSRNMRNLQRRRGNDDG